MLVFTEAFLYLLVSKGSKDSGIVNFKLSAMLGSFRVSVCDDRSNIADIRVQGRNIESIGSLASKSTFSCCCKVEIS